MRCLALAQAIHDAGSRVIFAISEELPFIEDRLKKEDMEFCHIRVPAGTPGDAEETVRIAKESGAEWVVIDGYSFGADYQGSIRDAGLCQLFIDDYGHADHYCADIVLNQNIYAGLSLYPAHEPYTRFLLGTDYVLLRKEFFNMYQQGREIPDVARKILITLGGSDPDNITLAIIEAIKTTKIPDIHIIVAVGGANPHTDLIDQAVFGLSHITVLKNAGNMPELMAWADMAISAGGSTCWELLYMGVPSIVIPIAGNQELVARELALRSLACVLSLRDAQNSPVLAETLSEILRSQKVRSGLSGRMVGYIDGKGPARIIHAMETPALILRNAEPTDCKMVWEWINDPDVRSVSFTQDPIPLDHHRAWFSAALSDPAVVYYLALEQGTCPIGQARFRIENQDATISVLVAPGHRRRSLGSHLIHDATEKLFAETGVENVKAFIKTGNEVSRKAFARAGYREEGLTEYASEPAFLFIKQRRR